MRNLCVQLFFTFSALVEADFDLIILTENYLYICISDNSENDTFQCKKKNVIQ